MCLAAARSALDRFQCLGDHLRITDVVDQHQDQPCIECIAFSFAFAFMRGNEHRIDIIRVGDIAVGFKLCQISDLLTDGAGDGPGGGLFIPARPARSNMLVRANQIDRAGGHAQIPLTQ